MYALFVDAGEIPYPVCTAAKIWNSDPIDAANFLSKIGVDSYELQWQTMKPFEDVPVFITGDTFAATSNQGGYIGWSETSLLNSERILVNYFGVKPYVPNLQLEKVMKKSKL